MKSLIDFEYTASGPWVTIIPLTDWAVAQYPSIMTSTEGTGKISIVDLPTFKLKVKQAGGRVCKARAIRRSDAELLAALDIN